MSELSEQTAQELLTQIQILTTKLETVSIEKNSDHGSRKPLSKKNYPELTWEEPAVIVPEEVELPDEQVTTHLARGKNGHDKEQ